MKVVCRRRLIVLALFASLYSVLVSATSYKLTIVPAANNKVVISWPTNAASYVLQSSTNLNQVNWLTVSNPAPVVVNTNNSVTYTNNSLTRFFRLFLATNATASFAGMVQIPAGTFTMGDVADSNQNGDAAPISVTVSAFYIDTNLVTSNLWQSVRNAAVSAGYGFANTGAAQGANHPVQAVDWYDVVKWCNARSQQAGLAPVYYLDAGFTQVYTNGEIDAIYANWATNGYRLPTEAEWEKAARGGLSGQRFPWGSTISESQANYDSFPSFYSYDLGPAGNNSAFETQGQPYTSPVGYFAANGYGLNDMAGDVMEWCWDWYGTPYAGGTDPHGPGSGSKRVSRGGDWKDTATYARCASRGTYLPSDSPSYIGTTGLGFRGFRCVRGH